MSKFMPKQWKRNLRRQDAENRYAFMRRGRPAKEDEKPISAVEVCRCGGARLPCGKCRSCKQPKRDVASNDDDGARARNLLRRLDAHAPAEWEGVATRFMQKVRLELTGRK